MQKITLDQAAPGMVLAKPVVNERGQTLVAERTELTETLLERLRRFGIFSVTVEGHPVQIPGQEPPDPAKIRLELERAFIRVADQPEMMRLKEIVLRHRLAHAEEIVAEMRRNPPAEGVPDAG